MSDSPQIPEITATDLNARFSEGDIPQLVDVREYFERRIADLPEHGQLRIPTGEILQRMHEIDPDRDAVVYCRSGSRSAWAVRLLRDRGVKNVINLKGGVLAWRAEVDNTVQRY